ncbi:hypothetical protein ASA1KI_20090 [Opitutales bacterium ASA1]|uniref:glycosyltransferase family 2 protein n=1 Tax=Congregicoccus parvus TaxID=3081749 RepID=UPI002B2AD4A6|nr:hypothetical protein ASA1KI_20090 [Opitutales bacterium ASA1]
MSAPAVSFIVPVYGRLDLTQAFVPNLRDSLPLGLDWEAVFVDDGSTDETPAFLRTLRPPFRSLLLPENGGYARAVNHAVRVARGSTLGLLNNDLVLAPGWLEPMLALLHDQRGVGAVGNIQINPATGLLDHAGVFFDPDGMPSHARKHRARIPRGDWRERNACTAACMLTPHAVFDALGGFDEQYRNGMEDIDYCVRLKTAGWRILVSHRSIVQHLVSSSPGRHDRNAPNTARFRARCAHVAAPWGVHEWPEEYLQRYARRLWKIDPRRGARAVLMLLRRLAARHKNPVA